MKSSHRPHSAHPRRRVGIGRRGRVGARRVQQQQRRKRLGGSTAGGGEKIGVTPHHQGLDQPVLRRDAEGRQGRPPRSTTSTSPSPPASRRATTRARSTRSRTPSPGRQGDPDHPDGDRASTRRSRRPATPACTSSRSTPRPTRPNTVDITFATDNFKAGKLDRPVGRRSRWTASRPSIALLDLFNDKIVSVDYNRDQGFLDRHGHPRQRPEEER